MSIEAFEERWKAQRERKAFLALEDGTVFHGVAFGASVERCGEVVFNTGMCGYQEILTDPSYAGQFVTLTVAEVGNYGVNREDVESRGLFLSGLVIGDYTQPSNFRSDQSLDEYLKANGVPGICGVDTRALTIHLRDYGNQKAYMCLSGEVSESEAVAKARSWEGLDGQDYAAKVTCARPPPVFSAFFSVASFITVFQIVLERRLENALSSRRRIVSGKIPVSGRIRAT